MSKRKIQTRPRFDPLHLIVTAEVILMPLALLAVIFIAVQQASGQDTESQPPVPTIIPAAQSVQRQPTPLPEAAAVQPTAVPSVSPTPTQAQPARSAPSTPGDWRSFEHCGSADQELTLLVLGIDTREELAEPGRADFIRVLHADFATSEVAILMLPRDLWISLPELSDYETDVAATFGEIPTGEWVRSSLPDPFARLNAAYFYGELYQLPGGGVETLADAIGFNFDLPIDGYVALEMAVFPSIVDALGGVTLYEPDGVEDFPAGELHLDGENALAYARVRKGGDDWQRGERQDRLLLALQQQALSPSTIVRVPQLVDAFAGKLDTDLSPQQLLALACLATKTDRDQIQTYSIDGSMVQDARTTQQRDVLIPDYTLIDELIGNFLSSEHPSPGSNASN